jgi:hypothetical protein
MVVKAEVECYSAEAKALDEDGLELVRSLFPNAHKSGDYLHDAEGFVDVDDLQEVVNKTGLRVQLKPFAGNVFMRQKDGVDKRLRVLEGELKLVRQQLAIDGTIVQVHVPNFSLLSFNQVEVQEDCCTDHLQLRLDQGWRIIAVCPPLDERRPTYILGRYHDEAAAKVSGGCR